MKTKSKSLILVLVVLICLTIIPISTIVANAVTPTTVLWGEVSVASEYGVGTIFNIPQRNVSIDGEIVTAQTALIYPSGKTFSARSAVLDENGVYTLNYTAEAKGKAFVDSKTFKVDYRVWQSGDSKTEATYGVHALAPEVEGLKIRLAEGDKLEFMQTIDLNGVTKKDKLVSFFVTADNPGALDFRKLFFQFTDISDPSVYLKIRAIAYEGEKNGDVPYSYFLAGGNGQSMQGWEASRKRLHIENNYGTSQRHSFMSAYNDGGTTELYKSAIHLSYDESENSVYVNERFVMDFDNIKYYTDFWQGFKSGKVRLSVWAENFESSTANFVLTSVKGVDLSQEIFIDKTAPIIEVDDSEIPTAKVGEEYEIFPASATDDYSGEREVTAEVLYNLTSNNAVSVTAVGGKFIPAREGLYAIKYQAKDYAGNIATKIVWVNAKMQVPAPIVILPSQKITEAKTGDWVKFDAPEITAGSGREKLKIIVSDGQNEWEVEDGFRPEKAIPYTIFYDVTDYIGQTTRASYTVSVTLSPAPVFVEKPVLPKYFITNSAYTLPTAYAVDYSSGKAVSVEAEIKVKDANGERVLAKGEKYTPKVSENFEPVTVTYSVNGATLEPFVVPTVFAWTIEEGKRPSLNYENYFAVDGVTLEKFDSYTTITTTKENGGWTYANSLVAQNFEMVLTGVSENSRFSGLSITLTDSVDERISATTQMIKNGAGIIFKTPTVEVEVETVGFSAQSVANRMKMGYSDGKMKIAGSSISIGKTDNGEQFNGFPSGKVYLSVSFINAQEGASYILNEVNGQTICNATLDRIGPRISVLGNYGGSCDINTQVVLPVAIAGDTVDPNVNFTLTVTSPSGKKVTALDGTVLDEVNPGISYTINCNEYGQYKVSYLASDTFNQRVNTTPLTYSITVEDCEKPTIKLNHKFSESARVGDIVTIPDFTVSDNYTKSDELKVIKSVLLPTGKILVLPASSNAVKVINTGDYKFIISVSDEAGNTLIYNATVKVTE